MEDNPILNPNPSHHVEGPFLPNELRLANRNSGTLLETIRQDITPVGAHYLLNHFDIPFVEDGKNWSVSTEGNFGSPQTFSLEQIQALPPASDTVTLECAGNGRGLLNPRWPSQPWHHEAVGNAKWTGTRLKHLIEQSQPDSQCRNLVFYGADEGVSGGDRHYYGRSLTLEQALQSDALLVWAMNDLPLQPQHGYPLRLIVPGWYGMASVKWLNRIVAQTEPFLGHQQVKTYWMKDPEGRPTEPITTMRVRSLLVPPGIPDWSSRKRLLDAGPVTLRGRAWSGGGKSIEKVELSVNGTWFETTLSKPDAPYAWTGWHYDWEAKPGQHRLSCRATDAEGLTQPIEPVWDFSGFCNNACHQVDVWCV